MRIMKNEVCGVTSVILQYHEYGPVYCTMCLFIFQLLLVGMAGLS